MFKFFLIFILLIFPVYAVSVSISSNIGNGQVISSGYTLENGFGHVEVVLGRNYFEETGMWSGDSASHISFQMPSPHMRMTTVWQDFSAHNRDTSWQYYASPRSIEIFLDSKPEK